MAHGTSVPLPSRWVLIVVHEDLLGFLLGALEPHETKRVERWLREDPLAREELARVERSLRPLQEGAGKVELPPPDLVSRTLANLPPLPAAGSDAGSGPPVAEDAPAAEHASGMAERQPAVAKSPSLSPMRSRVEEASGRSTGWIDWLAGSIAAAILLGLLLPALAEGRFEARKVACQDRLRDIGVAIHQFVYRNQQERLPAVAQRGEEAFAGMYAVHLHDTGLLQDESLRWCPSRSRPELLASDSELSRLVSSHDLYGASTDRLQTLQRFAGGHFAYTLGVVDEDSFTSPQFEARASFAIMSDAPLGRRAYNNMSVGPIESMQEFGHGGRGINVLYEDGHVRFVTIRVLDALPDHPLLNHRGQVEAGITIDDAVLAPSWHPPFVDARQRP